MTIASVFFILGWSLIATKRISISAYFEAQRYPLAKTLPWLFGISAILTGLFFLFGFFTQVASLIAMYILLNLMFIERREERIFEYPQGFYVLMMLIATSLLFSGAGAWGADLSI